MPAHRKELNIKGANLWYLVGLIATDGCLSGDGRHIDITSKEFDFLKTVKESTRISNRITEKYNTKNQKSYHIQIGNKGFYEFLLSIGLTPNKSLTLRNIKVPGDFFADFLRGVIDGDGCIRTWIHPLNKKEQWSLRIYSGSERFINWLKDKIMDYFEVKGKIHYNSQTVWVLKYGKMAARELARQCYYKDCLTLGRKARLAKACVGSYQGWQRSKTVLCN